MGTALGKVVQHSYSPDWVAWPEVGVSQVLVVGGINIPEKYISGVLQMQKQSEQLS